MEFKTDQEKFWAGSFSDQYIQCNQRELLLAGNISLFSKAIAQATGIKSIIEFGANIGTNLKALNLLITESEMFAVGKNSSAANQLKKLFLKKYIRYQRLEYSPQS